MVIITWALPDSNVLQWMACYNVTYNIQPLFTFCVRACIFICARVLLSFSAYFWKCCLYFNIASIFIHLCNLVLYGEASWFWWWRNSYEASLVLATRGCSLPINDRLRNRRKRRRKKMKVAFGFNLVELTTDKWHKANLQFSRASTCIEYVHNFRIIT